MKETHLAFDWGRVRAFLATTDAGSLSAAARVLGVAQPTLGRQIAALENELGVTLFTRSGHRLVLTEAGAEVLEQARAMAEAARRVVLTASGQSQDVAGRVTIAASEVYSAHLLPPVVARLRQVAPGITIEILASNRINDIGRREADIALRNVRPEDPNLIARRLGDDTGALYATPGYLDTIGHPASPGDCSGADFVGFDQVGQLLEGLNGMGFRLTSQNFPVVSANHLVQWEMVKAGAGIGIITTSIGDAEPAVVRVLPDMAPITFPLWLVTHRELKTSRRIRLVFDLLAEMLGRKQPDAAVR